MSEQLNIEGRICRLFGSDRPGCILIQPSARHENATLEAEAPISHPIFAAADTVSLWKLPPEI